MWILIAVLFVIAFVCSMALMRGSYGALENKIDTQRFLERLNSNDDT